MKVTGDGFDRRELFSTCDDSTSSDLHLHHSIIVEHTPRAIMKKYFLKTSLFRQAIRTNPLTQG